MTRQVSRTPARFPSGVNNSLEGGNPNTLMHALGALDPTRFHSYYNDFDVYAAGDWTATDVGTNTAALTGVDGGNLLVTTGTDNPASKYFQLVAAGFAPVAGYKQWFEVRFKTGSGTITLPDIVFGMQALDTTPLAVSDGIYFIKANGAATVDFIVKGSSTATTASAITSLAASTSYSFGWFYNGKDEVQYFVNGVKFGTAAITNLPSVVLTPSFGINATTAASQTLTMDYIWSCKERWTTNFTPAGR